MPNPSYFRRQGPELPPHDKRFRMRVGLNHFLVITTTVIDVSIEHYSKSAQKDPDWTMHLTYADNPQLEGLRHPQFGWDLVGLARLLWAQVMNPNPMQLTGAQRIEQGETVSASYEVINGAQAHRDAAETEALLRSVLQQAARPMTRLELVRAIGKTKSPWLISLIEGMVKRGAIQKTEQELENGGRLFLYSDNEFSAQ